MNMSKLTSVIPPKRKNFINKLIKKLSYNYTRLVFIKHPEIQFNMYVPRFNKRLWMDYHKNKCHEPVATSKFLEIIDKLNNPIIWDIGSMFGYYSMVAYNYIKEPNKYINLFEPNRDHLKIIKKNNIKLASGKINIVPKAVGKKTDKDTITGDEYQVNNQCPEIIKIDVDGAEIEVLNGMKQTLIRCNPYILLEVHFFVKDYISHRKKIIDYFSDLNYNFKICMDHRNYNFSWNEIKSINNIPEKNTHGSEDYMLLCEPRKDI